MKRVELNVSFLRVLWLLGIASMVACGDSHNQRGISQRPVTEALHKPESVSPQSRQLYRSPKNKASVKQAGFEILKISSAKFHVDGNQVTLALQLDIVEEEARVIKLYGVIEFSEEKGKFVADLFDKDYDKSTQRIVAIADCGNDPKCEKAIISVEYQYRNLINRVVFDHQKHSPKPSIEPHNHDDLLDPGESLAEARQDDIEVAGSQPEDYDFEIVNNEPEFLDEGFVGEIPQEVYLVDLDAFNNASEVTFIPAEENPESIAPVQSDTGHSAVVKPADKVIGAAAETQRPNVAEKGFERTARNKPGVSRRHAKSNEAQTAENLDNQKEVKSLSSKQVAGRVDIRGANVTVKTQKEADKTDTGGDIQSTAGPDAAVRSLPRTVRPKLPEAQKASVLEEIKIDIDRFILKGETYIKTARLHAAWKASEAQGGLNFAGGYQAVGLHGLKDKETEKVIQVGEMQVYRRGDMPSFLPKEGKGFSGKKSQLNRYATGFTISIIKKVASWYADLYKDLYPNSKLHIRNISKKGGKILGQHTSHQSGLDIDIRYLGSEDIQYGNYSALSNGRRGSIDPQKYDFVRNNNIYRLFNSSKYLLAIFVDQRIKKQHCQRMNELGLDITGKQRSFIQKLYNVAGHHNHMHIRLMCSPEHSRCRMQTNIHKARLNCARVNYQGALSPASRTIEGIEFENIEVWNEDFSFWEEAPGYWGENKTGIYNAVDYSERALNRGTLKESKVLSGYKWPVGTKLYFHPPEDRTKKIGRVAMAELPTKLGSKQNAKNQTDKLQLVMDPISANYFASYRTKFNQSGVKTLLWHPHMPIFFNENNEIDYSPYEDQRFSEGKNFVKSYQDDGTPVLNPYMTHKLKIPDPFN